MWNLRPDSYVKLVVMLFGFSFLAFIEVNVLSTHFQGVLIAFEFLGYSARPLESQMLTALLNTMGIISDSSLRENFALSFVMLLQLLSAYVFYALIELMNQITSKGYQRENIPATTTLFIAVTLMLGMLALDFSLFSIRSFAEMAALPNMPIHNSIVTQDELIFKLKDTATTASWVYSILPLANGLIVGIAAYKTKCAWNGLFIMPEAAPAHLSPATVQLNDTNDTKSGGTKP